MSWRMKQFPQEGLFSNLLRAGNLTVEHIEKLARTLAAYYATGYASCVLAKRSSAG